MNLAVFMLIGDDDPNRTDDQRKSQSETVKFIISWSDKWGTQEARLLLFCFEHILFFFLIVMIYKWVVIPEDVKDTLNARGQEMGLAQKRMASLREELPEYNSIRNRKLMLKEFLDLEIDSDNEDGRLMKDDFDGKFDYNKQVIKEMSNAIQLMTSKYTDNTRAVLINVHK